MRATRRFLGMAAFGRRRRCRPFRALTPTGWGAVAFLAALAITLLQLPWSTLP